MEAAGIEPASGRIGSPRRDHPRPHCYLFATIRACGRASNGIESQYKSLVLLRISGGFSFEADVGASALSFLSFILSIPLGFHFSPPIQANGNDLARNHYP